MWPAHTEWSLSLFSGVNKDILDHWFHQKCLKILYDWWLFWGLPYILLLGIDCCYSAKPRENPVKERWWKKIKNAKKMFKMPTLEILLDCFGCHCHRLLCLLVQEAWIVCFTYSALNMVVSYWQSRAASWRRRNAETSGRVSINFTQKHKSTKGAAEQTPTEPLVCPAHSQHSRSQM